jgi:hypothetical protein
MRNSLARLIKNVRLIPIGVSVGLSRERRSTINRMAETSFEFNPSCGECGSNSLIGPDDMTDESTITCETCGADLGTLGELKISALRLAEEKVAEETKGIIGETFKGIENVKFTESDD